jgi:hypothetical protein
VNREIDPVAVPKRDSWFKSSYSNAAASCVEVKFAEGQISVRDSKDRRTASPTIGVGSIQWAAFLDDVQNSKNRIAPS